MSTSTTSHASAYSPASSSAPSAEHSPSHVPHPHHPLPLPQRDQAFDLYCSGLRSPAIAHQLHVPERTVRAWLAATQQALTRERHGTAQAAAALAEARQLQIAASAWESYRRHAAAEQQQLDDLQYGTRDELDAHPPRLSASGARYLALALRATDLAARFAGAYACPPPKPAAMDLRILMARPGPEHYEPPMGPNVAPLTGLALEQYQHQMWVDSLQSQIDDDLTLVAKGRARLAEINAMLATGPTDADHDDQDDPDQDDEDDEDDEDDGTETEDGGGASVETTAVSPAESATSVTGDSEFPAESATAPIHDSEIPAETAVAPIRDSEIPAESTAVSGSPLRAGEGPGVRLPPEGGG